MTINRFNPIQARGAKYKEISNLPKNHNYTNSNTNIMTLQKSAQTCYSACEYI